MDARRRRAIERGGGEPGARTELSQYSPGLLALLFDKSCRNLSRGHFQRYCRKPPRLPPIVRPPCTAFSSTADCDPTTTTLSSMPIQLVNSSVFSHTSFPVVVSSISRVSLCLSFLIGGRGEQRREREREERSIEYRVSFFLSFLFFFFILREKERKEEEGKNVLPHARREGEKVKGMVERRERRKGRKEKRGREEPIRSHRLVQLT